MVKKLSDRITRLEGGNKRIQVIELNFETKICLINTHLPTNKKDSEYIYSECLDIVHDTLHRYERSHHIILCGDLNGTLLPTRNKKHDLLLKEFVNENSLSNNGHYSVKPTFYHLNGTATFQIDYILTNKPEIFETYSIIDKESCNVSSHVPVEVRLNIDSGKIHEEKCDPNKKSNQTKQTLLWNKIDLDKYLSEIKYNLPTITSKVSHPESAANSVTECLVAAAQIAVPVKNVKLKGP